MLCHFISFYALLVSPKVAKESNSCKFQLQNSELDFKNIYGSWSFDLCMYIMLQYSHSIPTPSRMYQYSLDESACKDCLLLSPSFSG